MPMRYSQACSNVEGSQHRSANPYRQRPIRFRSTVAELTMTTGNQVDFLRCKAAEGHLRHGKTSQKARFPCRSADSVQGYIEVEPQEQTRSREQPDQSRSLWR